MNALPVKSVDEILAAVENFPRLPAAVADILRTLDDENAEVDYLARKIQGDTGLLADVLRMANSPRYSIRGGVADVKKAVVVLGFNAVRNLASVVGISAHFREAGKGHDAFDLDRYMQHSIGVACCAKFLPHKSRNEADTAFVCGLLHDMGQLAIAFSMPDEFRMIVGYQMENDCHFSEAEQAVLGVDHAWIGAQLANRWNFPDAICEAIGGHHRITGEAPSRMADMVHVAEVLSHALDFGEYGEIPPLSGDAMLRLGLSFHQLRPLFGKIENEYCGYSEMLGVH